MNDQIEEWTNWENQETIDELLDGFLENPVTLPKKLKPSLLETVRDYGSRRFGPRNR